MQFATAGIFVVMAVTQLFTYESFITVFHGTKEWGRVIAACIVTLEVASLPYLLSMRLSAAGRFVSQVAGLAVAAVWVILSVILPSGTPSGIFGAVVDVPGGLVSAGIAMLIGIMVFVASGYKR